MCGKRRADGTGNVELSVGPALAPRDDYTSPTMAWAEAGMYDGATEPLWYGERKVWSVTGFIVGVRSRIVDIPTLWVEGEISELKVPRPGQKLATVFFTLKD